MFVVELVTDSGDDGDLYGPFATYKEARDWTKKMMPSHWTSQIIAEVKKP